MKRNRGHLFFLWIYMNEKLFFYFSFDTSEIYGMYKNVENEGAEDDNVVLLKYACAV